MSDSAWYAACLAETAAWLDQFADVEEVQVHRESDIVAALCGLLSGAAIIHSAAKYAEAGVNTLSLLETDVAARDATRDAKGSDEEAVL